MVPSSAHVKIPPIFRVLLHISPHVVSTLISLPSSFLLHFCNATTQGFPWTLRLRNVMEVATDIASAQALWLAANNTCGFNHAVGSAAVADEGQPRFMALETDAEHTVIKGKERVVRGKTNVMASCCQKT